MVHSFGSSAPPFTTHSTAFESTLKRELGTAVDLDEVSLDMARYAQPDMEEAFAEFLGKRMSEWQPDLVVPIGSPAGKFVAKFRDKLFPQTPVIYSGMDRRTLPADAFAKNATFVGENFDLKGLVEDMLQLDPETNHVVVILGATSLERYWTAAFQEAFEPFTGRVKFTWVNDLSFDQMLDLVSKLPPHSFVLLGLFMRDASGVTYNEDDALVRLHAVSQAPISGLYQHQMGLGIVGGRLYQGELEGVESARVAARILRGERASSFPPLFIGTRPPTYDWRELTRWGISESRLPPGSVVMFRQPTVWERYRWQMVGAVALIATQAVLIFALLVQRRRRTPRRDGPRRAQAEVQQKRTQAGARRTRGHPGRAHRNPGARNNPATRRDPRQLLRRNRLLDAPEPDLQEVRAALSRHRRDHPTGRRSHSALRDMLKRDTPGFTSLDLNQLIRDVDRIVHGDAVAHKVTVELDLSPGVLPVKADSVQLQQVMLNLMLNAFSAMGEAQLNGARRLIVRTKSIDASNVLVELQDSGTGIAPEKLESIFDPFITSKRDGLGIGLSISRTIVERHGGKVWAANNPDRGATFSITLPVSASESDRVAHGSSRTELLRRTRSLLVRGSWRHRAGAPPRECGNGASPGALMSRGSAARRPATSRVD